MEHKKYVKIISILSFSIGAIMLIISGVNPDFTIQNLLFVFAFICSGIGIGVVIGSTNFRKQQGVII